MSEEDHSTQDSTPEVAPDPESRLEALIAQYEALKTKADEASERFEACKSSIKALVASEHPEARRVVVRSPSLTVPLELVAIETMRFDNKKFKAADPLEYCRYTYKSTSWQLRKVK